MIKHECRHYDLLNFVYEIHQFIVSCLGHLGPEKCLRLSAIVDQSTEGKGKRMKWRVHSDNYLQVGFYIADIQEFNFIGRILTMYCLFPLEDEVNWPAISGESSFDGKYFSLVIGGGGALKAPFPIWKLFANIHGKSKH